MNKKTTSIVVALLISMAAFSQKSKGRNVALEKTNPQEYSKKMEEYKKTSSGNENNAPKKTESGVGDTTKKISAFETSSRRERKKLDLNSSNNNMAQGMSKDSTKTNTPPIANTSAIAHGEANIKTEAVAKVYKYKAEESQVDYYKDLRKKFEVEEKERKEKEAILAKEKAKKEDDLRNSRHLSEDQAPQFDKYREGAKNPIEKKTTAEEDYNKLFK